MWKLFSCRFLGTHSCPCSGFLKTVLIYSVDFRLVLITAIIHMYLRLLISDLDLHSAEVHIVSILGIVHSYY